MDNLLKQVLFAFNTNKNLAELLIDMTKKSDLDSKLLDCNAMTARILFDDVKPLGKMESFREDIKNTNIARFDSISAKRSWDNEIDTAYGLILELKNKLTSKEKKSLKYLNDRNTTIHVIEIMADFFSTQSKLGKESEFLANVVNNFVQANTTTNPGQLFAKVLAQNTQFITKGDSPLSALLATVVALKATAKDDKNEVTRNLERYLEPYACVLAESEFSGDFIQNKIIREQTKELAQYLVKDSKYKSDSNISPVNAYFHDLATSILLKSASINPEFWNVGLNKSDNLSFVTSIINGDVIDNTFQDVTPVEESDIITLAKNADKKPYIMKLLFELENKLVADKAIQGAKGIERRELKPEDISKVILTTFMLADSLNVELGEEMVIALSNPLIEVSRTVGNKARNKEIFDSSVNLCNEILQNEGVNFKLNNPFQSKSPKPFTQEILKTDKVYNIKIVSQLIKTCKQYIKKMESKKPEKTVFYKNNKLDNINLTKDDTQMMLKLGMDLGFYGKGIYKAAVNNKPFNKSKAFYYPASLNKFYTLIQSGEQDANSILKDLLATAKEEIKAEQETKKAKKSQENKEEAPKSQTNNQSTNEETENKPAEVNENKTSDENKDESKTSDENNKDTNKNQTDDTAQNDNENNAEQV